MSDNYYKEYIKDANKISILHKEIDLFQGVINRMASNSMFCKKIAIGLTIVFAGFLKLLYSQYTSLMFIDKLHIAIVIILGIASLISLAYIDVKYLMLEKKYRDGYEEIVGLRAKYNNFQGWMYCLSPYYIESLNTGRKYSYRKVIFSFSIFPFYIIPIVILALAPFIII